MLQANPEIKGIFAQNDEMALGALAATINASSGNTVNIYFMTNYQVYAFLAGILGGFSTFYGPVIAALMIPLANNLVQYFVNVIGGQLVTKKLVIK